MSFFDKINDVAIVETFSTLRQENHIKVTFKSYFNYWKPYRANISHRRLYFRGQKLFVNCLLLRYVN